jgi:NADH:ubiquinone oxidoreductase subunit 6 (subunit J)
MSRLRAAYLALAIVGAVVPMYHFVTWFLAEGWSLQHLIDGWHANAATTGLVWDLTISAVTLTIFIVAEALFRRDAFCLIAIPATFLIGVSCGLPLYLFLRTRNLP